MEIIPLFLVPLALTTSAPAPPVLEAPADGAVLYVAVPSFVWGPVFRPEPSAMPSYGIQIAADAGFEKVVDEDTLAAVITYYVPDRPLGPGTYHWRVAGVDAAGRRGAWSAVRTFTVREPRAFHVPKGATFEQIRETIAKAAASGGRERGMGILPMRPETVPVSASGGRAKMALRRTGETPAPRAGGAARVVFEKAMYVLNPAQPKPLIELDGAADLTIDGNGAVIVFHRPAPMAQITRCRRVLVRGLTFDYDPPTYTGGRIAAVDAKAGTIDVDILPGHLLPDAHPRFDEDRKGMIVTEAEGFAMKRGVRLVVAHAGFERVEGRRYRFRFARPGDVAPLARGDVYVLDPRWQQAAGGAPFCIRGGEEVVLYDLTIHGAPNECLSSFYADRHAILHVRLARKPGRALSVNNGGNNHHNARRGPWIEGCLFENTGDDVCHVNGYAMSIAAQPAPDRIDVRIPTPYDQFCIEAALDFRVGDRLCFFHRAAGRLIGERRIKAVRREGKLLAVTLEKGIAGVTPGRLLPAKGAAHAAADNAAITHLFNAGRSCNQFVFRNNTARNGRRIGVLAKGDGGLIENNLFEGLGGGGVEFWNAPFEGLGAENYVVRNNRIVHCLRLRRKHAAIWCIAFRPGGSRIHRNLLIEDNEIAGGGAPAADVGDAENVVFRNNRIRRPEVAGIPGEEVLQFRNVTKLVREGNEITRPARKIEQARRTQRGLRPQP